MVKTKHCAQGLKAPNDSMLKSLSLNTINK